MKTDKSQDKYNEIFQELREEKMNWDFEDFLAEAEKEKNLNTRIQSLTQEKEEKDRLLYQAKSLSDQFRSNVDSLQRQLQTAQSSSSGSTVIAFIIALIIGLAIGLAMR